MCLRWIFFLGTSWRVKMTTSIANNNFNAIEQVGLENVVQVVIDNGIIYIKKCKQHYKILKVSIFFVILY